MDEKIVIFLILRNNSQRIELPKNLNLRYLKLSTYNIKYNIQNYIVFLHHHVPLLIVHKSYKFL